MVCSWCLIDIQNKFRDCSVSCPKEEQFPSACPNSEAFKPWVNLDFITHYPDQKLEFSIKPAWTLLQKGKDLLVANRKAEGV